jgi:hypothetical protein
VSDTSTLTSYYTQAGVHYKDVVLHADGTAETISLNGGTTIGFNGNGAFSDRDWETQFDYTDGNHYGDIRVRGWSTPYPYMVEITSIRACTNDGTWRRTA